MVEKLSSLNSQASNTAVGFLNKRITFDYLVFLMGFLLLASPDLLDIPFRSLLLLSIDFVAVVLAVKKHIRLHSQVIFVWLYFSALFMSTIINGMPTSPLSILIKMLHLASFTLLTDYQFIKDKKACINGFAFILTILCVLDIVSVVFYPRGISQQITYWNQWSSSITPIWLFGNKNSHFRYFAPWIVVMALRAIESNKKCRARLELCVCCLLSLLTSIMLESSTSIVALLVIIFGALMINFGNSRFDFNPYLLAFLVFLFEGVILFGQTSFLSDFLQNIFGKDTTFSSRTLIWARTEALVSAKPILGWGVLTNEQASALLGHQAFVNSHNQFLNTLFQGGFIAFSFLLIWFLTSLSSLSHASRSIRPLLSMFYIAMMIEMIFEQQFDSNLFVLNFILCSLIASHYEQNIRRDNEFKQDNS